MIDNDRIRRIEEASFNAWPALNMLLYDGWLLRFANGYTKRANSINGLYQGRLPLERKVSYCESIYNKKGIQPIFRLTPLINREHLDRYLQARHYTRIDQTSVQLLGLQGFQPAYSQRAKILIEADGIASWLHYFHKLNPHRTDAASHKLILQNVLGQLGLMVLMVKQEIVACGLAVADGDNLGLFDIVTAVAHRRQGYGAELTSSLLAWGKSVGTKYAYLQVMISNDPGLQLYRGLGFQEIYQYWYRVAADSLEVS